MDHKTFKLDTQPDGTVQAVFATLNVKDKDGDVTLPGAFGEQHVKIVGSHDWGQIMLGKGTIREDGDRAIFEGKINTDPDHVDARALYSMLKFDMDNPPAQIEWSYGFDILDGGAERGTFKGDQVRFLKPTATGEPGLKVFEVSPVLVGAGENTGTLAVKSKTGWVFADQIKLTLEAVQAVGTRATEILALRKEDGTGRLGDRSAEAITQLIDQLGDTTSLLSELVEAAPEPTEPKTTEPPTDPPDPVSSVDMDAEMARFEATRARLLGVPLP